MIELILEAIVVLIICIAVVVISWHFAILFRAIRFKDKRR